jgi:RNA polymerase sigma-70 factor (ECF subfamily)
MGTLARQAAAGDAAALESLLAQIRPQVLRRCSRMLPCFEDAEEACQDALMQVATSIGRFEGRSLFSTWLYVVVGNSSRQTYRRLKQRSAETAHAALPVEPVDPRTTSVIAGSRLDFLDAGKLEARRPELAGALVRRDICQLDYSEIASFRGGAGGAGQVADPPGPGGRTRASR